jgi:exopolysaccharide biosynthesis polyprenyl glycosylphosphotransferase
MNNSIQTKFAEFKETFNELNISLQRDMVRRRYQMWMQGQVPMEDRLMDTFAKFKTQTVQFWRMILKRALDVSFSLAAIVITLPVMMLIAAAIKITSKGPIVYKQVRVGKKGKLFEIYKFRTMKIDAETSTGPIWAKQNDPRVTIIGNFLRTTHLDELPQFFNVLKGEMSVVGPRPERPHFVSEFRKSIPHYDRRLCAKPGITGLAQIRRSYDETLADVRRKLKYDVVYIHKMCPFLDVKVIAMTVGAVVFRNGR